MNKLPRFEEERFLAQSLKNPYTIEKYEKVLIGSAIKSARKKAGMSQKQLAHLLKTSQSVIARMESGKQNFTVRTLIIIGLALGKKLQIKFQ